MESVHGYSNSVKKNNCKMFFINFITDQHWLASKDKENPTNNYHYTTL